MPYPAQPPQRGELYWVDWNPARGSEQAGHRPAVIVSRNEFNRGTRVALVAAVTASPQQLSSRRNARTCVYLPQGSPTRDESLVLAFQVSTIDQARLEDYIGRLAAEQLAQLDAALRHALGL